MYCYISVSTDHKDIFTIYNGREVSWNPPPPYLSISPPPVGMRDVSAGLWSTVTWPEQASHDNAYVKPWYGYAIWLLATLVHLAGKICLEFRGIIL